MVTPLFVVISLVVSIGLFFALRSLNIWYLKINVLLENQETQKEMLRKLLELNNVKTDIPPITENPTVEIPPLNNLLCEGLSDIERGNIETAEASSQKTAIILTILFVFLMILYAIIR